MQALRDTQGASVEIRKTESVHRGYKAKAEYT